MFHSEIFNSFNDFINFKTQVLSHYLKIKKFRRTGIQ